MACLIFGSSTPQTTDIATASDYAMQTKIRLAEVYDHVATKLGLNHTQMQRQYNKNLNFHNYQRGDKVWLRRKYFKAGETQKLVPQRSGPWTVLEKLANGVNFRIQNDSTKKTQFVHHNQLYPAKIVDTPENTRQGDTEHNEGEIVTQDVQVDDAFLDEDFSSSDESETDPGQNRRYPMRNRRQRTIEGSIPWDSINVVEHKTL